MNEEHEEELRKYQKIILENKTNTLEEVLALSKLLLADEEAYRIISSAGLARDFTTEEQEVIISLVRGIKCPTALGNIEDANFKKFSRPWRNLGVATGVVRRISAGEYTGLDDPQVSVHLEKNVSYAGRPSHEMRSDTKRISWSDFYRVLVEYLKLPRLAELVKKWHEAGMSGGDYRSLFWDANEPAIEIALRYGLTLETRFVHIAHLVMSHNIDWENEGLLKSFLRESGKSETQFLEGLDD